MGFLLFFTPPSPPPLLLLQPKLGKVSNVVKASLEETLRNAKSDMENAEINKEIEADKVDVTLPG